MSLEKSNHSAMKRCYVGGKADFQIAMLQELCEVSMSSGVIGLDLLGKIGVTCFPQLQPCEISRDF